MSTLKKIKRAGRHKAENAQLYSDLIEELIQFFDNKIDPVDYRNLNKQWLLAQKASDANLRLDMSKKYIMKFENDILSGDPSRMLAYDYSKLIVKDCDPDTKRLILTLSDQIKICYRDGDEPSKQFIAANLKDMVSACSCNDKLEKKIKKLNSLL